MALAFADEFGIQDAFGAIPMGGRTDAWILSRAAAAHGVECDAVRAGRFRARYLEHLAREVHSPGPRKGIMPGVRSLIEALAARDNVLLGLLTGNFEGGARLKLEYFDLWRYFQCGAFGDEALDRNGLLATALARAEACGLRAPDPSRIVIVGDTPLDVAVAQAGGVRSVAVATGSHGREALEAAGADVVLENFSDLAATLAALGCRL
jgi:phosphoglycolate phosphatase-like HAD superfamily hydrolase